MPHVAAPGEAAIIIYTALRDAAAGGSRLVVHSQQSQFPCACERYGEGLDQCGWVMGGRRDFMRVSRGICPHLEAVGESHLFIFILRCPVDGCSSMGSWCLVRLSFIQINSI